jgi:hypothetical protein
MRRQYPTYPVQLCGSVVPVGTGLYFHSQILLSTYSTHVSGAGYCPYSAGNFTTPNGTITIPPNYASNVNCEYVVTTGAPIVLRFDSFDTEAGYDFVEVYDGTSATGTLKGKFSGSKPLPIQTATSGSMFIRFTSDDSTARGGVSMTWLTPTTDGIHATAVPLLWLLQSILTCYAYSHPDTRVRAPGMLACTAAHTRVNSTPQCPRVEGLQCGCSHVPAVTAHAPLRLVHVPRHIAVCHSRHHVGRGVCSTDSGADTGPVECRRHVGADPCADVHSGACHIRCRARRLDRVAQPCADGPVPPHATRVDAFRPGAARQSRARSPPAGAAPCAARLEPTGGRRNGAQLLHGGPAGSPRE